MKRLFDVYQANKLKLLDVHFGVDLKRYTVSSYKCVMEDDWSRSEDSKAYYHDWGAKEPIEIIDLNPILDVLINGEPIKEYVDRVLSAWPPYAGSFWTTSEVHELYRFLDEIDGIENYIIYSNIPSLPTLEEIQTATIKADAEWQKVLDVFEKFDSESI